MRLRLLDLDGSVVAQPGLRERVVADGLIVDLRDLGPALRLWAGRRALQQFAHRIDAAGEPGGQGAVVTFVGSGDYHHLSTPLVARIDEPVTLVHFDNHPDWGLFPPANHCGSWVNRVLDLTHVVRVVTIGPCAEQVTWPQLKGANLRALRGGRLVFHPLSYAPSRVIGDVDGGPDHPRRGNRIVWTNVADEDWEGFVTRMVGGVPTEAVYVSIDKDVLDPRDALTNWNQGKLRLDALLGAIAILGRGRRIAGADICGDFAPPRHRNPLKKLLSVLDQPPVPTAPDLSRNEQTNLRLYHAFAATGM